MKQSIIKYLIIALVISLTGACTKFLDIKPKGVDVVSTIDQYNGLFNNSLLVSFGNYTIQPGGVTPGDYANLSIFLSDETFTTMPYNSSLEASYINGYHWSPDVYLPTQDAAEWNAFYTQNYTYNVIANGVMNASDGTELQKKQLLAEARANRAYLHFWLVNYFGKPYDAASASTDPGVPLITTPDASGSAGPRVSVQAVYDFVIKELSAAITDLPDSTLSRLRLAKPAATFMLGQVYFFMGKYDSALIELNATRTGIQNSPIPMDLYDYNVVLDQWTPPVPNFPPTFPLAPNNEEAICQRQTTVGLFRGVSFLNPAYSLYDSTDLRLRLFSETDFSGQAVYPSWSRAAPFQVNYGPSVPNLFLMLAECKARTGDITGATADLVTLRAHRMPAADAPVLISDADSLVRFIVAERYREYALTGFNWFDVRRLWNDPLFTNKSYIHTDSAGTYTLTADRLVLKIPPKVMSYNPGMKDNP